MNATQTYYALFRRLSADDITEAGRIWDQVGHLGLGNYRVRLKERLKTEVDYSSLVRIAKDEYTCQERARELMRRDEVTKDA